MTNNEKITKKILERFNNIENLLLNQKIEDKTMSINEVSEYLNLSKSYIYKLTMKGKIPHFKPLGKKLYFSKLELDKWVKTHF